MSINLVQWEGSTVTPKLDAIMYDDGSYGIIKGCAITHQGTNLLKIANGFIKIAGRLIEIAEETIQCQVSASGTVNGQLWLRLDLSSVTPAVFMTEAAAVLTPLTQNADCNFQNGIYELQLATYNIDESVITNLVETAPELERLRTALDNIDLAANKVTYDNTHSGLSANKVQGAIDEINDNLSGFKFYPIGTNLVALVADDSFYTDATGKYVLADSPTGQTLLEDTATYKALASTEDCRGEVGADSATPFSKKTRTITKQISVPPYSGSDLTSKETVFTELTEIVGITKITGDGAHPSYHQSEFFSAETYDNIVKITVYRKQPSPTTAMVFNVTVAGY